MKRRVARIVVLAALALLVMEMASRIVVDHTPLLDRLQVFDESWMRLRWAQRHRHGIEIYYHFDLYDPLLGWRTQPDLRAFQAFGGCAVSTNSMGFRSLSEFELHAPEDRTRIIVLGDSFTFGDEVSDSEVYTHVLAGLLPEAEVLNLGVHGYGHDQMYLLLQHEGPRLDPDVVVLGFVYVDIYRNLLGFNDYAKPRFTLNGTELSLTDVPVPRPQETIAREPLRLKSVDLVRLTLASFSERSGRMYREARELSRHILAALVREVRRLGAVPVFVYLPIGDEVNDPRPDLLGTEEYMVEICEQHGVPWSSARRVFAERVEDGHQFLNRPGGHWGEDGHRAVAESIRRLLLRQGLVQIHDPGENP
jgi:hypothetical protein